MIYRAGKKYIFNKRNPKTVLQFIFMNRLSRGIIHSSYPNRTQFKYSETEDRT